MLLSLCAAIAIAHPATYASPCIEGELTPAKSRELQNTTDKQLWAAWAKLTEEERFEVVESFRQDVPFVGTFQIGLEQFVLQLLEVDRGLLPDRAKTEFFDPETHAPAQPIRRSELAPDNPKAAKIRERFLEERLLRSAWAYDWGSREVVRIADPKDSERIFANAMAGFTPDADLAEALLIQQLDRGDEQEAFAAFGHAYTDRAGNVYPGVTLYDAWASGENMEMPDVDVLGLLFSTTGSYGKFKAPVSRQKKLYDKVGEQFQDAHNYRAIREAVARLYLQPNPVMPRGYQANVDRLHSLWDKHSSEIDKMRADLPDAAGWERYLKTWVNRVRRTKKLRMQGINRRKTLESDAWAVRWTLLRVMQRFGALP